MNNKENLVIYPAVAFIGPIGSGKSLRLKALVNEHLVLGHRTHLFRYPDVANHQLYIEKIKDFTSEAQQRMQLGLSKIHRLHWHIALDESHCYLDNFNLLAPKVMQFFWFLVNNHVLPEIDMSLSLTSDHDAAHLLNFKKVLCSAS